MTAASALQQQARRIAEQFAEGGLKKSEHIVYNLVTQMLGGTIEVFSALGRGTRVVVQFPAVVPNAAA